MGKASRGRDMELMQYQIEDEKPEEGTGVKARNIRYYQKHKAERYAAKRERYKDPEKRLENTRAEYLRRKFVPIDGEGINVRSGKRKGEHDYCLLAIHHVPAILKRDGLSTADCLGYLWKNLDPANINIIYGGSYDFNSWIKDFPRHELERLYKGERVKQGPYTVKWMRGKYFRISREGKTVTIYDVVSFFQKPFVGACDEYLGDYEHRDILVREKANRGNFTFRQIAKIGKYNELELDLLEKLAIELRLRLDKVGLRPSKWIGPGAIASALFVRERVPDHMDKDIPAPVKLAAQYAYAGGRFECLKFGISKESAYEYDINSAYPKALSLVPSLKGGTWSHRSSGISPRSIKEFGVYRIRWNGTAKASRTAPGPYFIRNSKGNISYPMQGENWVWSPEAKLIQRWRDAGFHVQILEAWEFEPATKHKPFGFVPALYERRKALKAAGDGAHVGLKLALNSMYGKTAQQVGWDTKKNEAPRFHQLEWAGWVTSYCRAMVAEAALLDLDAVIAFETDALFTSHPLPLPVSDRLGEWELTEFESLTYAQSGVYFGGETAKGRGIERGELSREAVEAAMTADLWATVPVHVTRYVTLGAAFLRGLELWRRWVPEVRTLKMYPWGKRAPLRRKRIDGWMPTFCPNKNPGIFSEPYPLEWSEPPEDMEAYRLLRDSEVEWDM